MKSQKLSFSAASSHHQAEWSRQTVYPDYYSFGTSPAARCGSSLVEGTYFGSLASGNEPCHLDLEESADVRWHVSD